MLTVAEERDALRAHVEKLTQAITRLLAARTAEFKAEVAYRQAILRGMSVSLRRRTGVDLATAMEEVCLAEGVLRRACLDVVAPNAEDPPLC